MVSRPVVDGITGFRHRAASRWNGAAKDTPNPPAITTPMPTPAGVTKSGPVAAARLGGDGRAHRRPARRVPERGGWGGQPCDELAGRLGRVDLTGPPGLGGEPRMALNTRGVVRSGYPLPVRPGPFEGMTKARSSRRCRRGVSPGGFKGSSPGVAEAFRSPGSNRPSSPGLTGGKMPFTRQASA